MGTTTIRVDTQTHRQLLAMSKAAGVSLTATVRAASEALRRQRFADQVKQELADLRTDPEAWSAYLAESEATTVRDGLD